MSYRLWVDDKRAIPRGDSDWLHATTSEEFIQIIQQNGLPYYISFDHDLGGSDTAMICAHWLIDRRFIIPEYDVHSQNPVGTRNIIGLLESYKQFQLREEAEKAVFNIIKDLSDRGGFNFSDVWKQVTPQTQKGIIDLWTSIVHNTMKFEIEKRLQLYEELIRR